MFHMKNPEFKKWRKMWIDLATFSGDQVPTPEEKIGRLIELWNQEIPDGWQRENLPKTFEWGYRRSLGGKKQTPEHELEKRLFKIKSLLKIDGYGSVDLLANAFPLAKWRSVEADMVAVAKKDVATEIMVIEAKDKANNAWYAAVENLHQLKLFDANRRTNLEFLKNKVSDCVQGELAITGLVIAPPDFFEHKGQKGNATQPAKNLVAAFQRKLGVRVLFGKLHEDSSRIEIISQY